MTTTLTDIHLAELQRTLPAGHRARPFEEGDREAMVAIRNLEVHPVQRMTAEDWRVFDRINVDPTELRLVVEAPDRTLVGALFLGSGGGMRHPDGAVHGGVNVAPAARGRGLGSALLAAFEAEARRRAAPRVLSSANAARPFALEWATRRGYREIGRRIESFLDLERFAAAAFAAERARPGPSIRFAPVREVLAGRDGAAHDAFWRALYEAEAPAWDDVPWATPTPHWPYEHFHRMYAENPRFSLDASIVAYDGERIVGQTTSLLMGADKALTGFTGTVRSHRGRGIAFALKLAAIAAAGRAGLRWMLTTNDEPNRAMRGINRRLGYEMLPAEVELEKRLG